MSFIKSEWFPLVVIFLDIWTFVTIETVVLYFRIGFGR
jgi:hypothetical protein